MFYIEPHWIRQNTLKTSVCCLFSDCGINYFRMASSNSSLAAKSCACAYIAFLAGVSPGMRTVFVNAIQKFRKAVQLCQSLYIQSWHGTALKIGTSGFPNIWLRIKTGRLASRTEFVRALGQRYLKSKKPGRSRKIGMNGIPNFDLESKRDVWRPEPNL
jgi:hypothetical protein